MKIHMNHEETVSKIFNLMDTCKRCVRVFEAAGRLASTAELRDLIGKISQTIVGYQFELQKEARRIEEADSENVADGVVSVHADIHEPKCRRNLEVILSEYRSALRSKLPPHARAMMLRQCREIDSFYREWSRLTQPA